LDIVLVERGLVASRSRARDLIRSGHVRVGADVCTKAGFEVAETATLSLDDPGVAHAVSRGGQKLAAALAAFEFDPAGRIALDVGASTGGFTDLLLRRGAERVYALDVGYGQLHYKLRTDPRVIPMERTNVRHLTSLPEPVDLAVADVSFISLRLALPAVFGLVKSTIVALIKPQFEAGRGQVGKGGIVRDAAIQQQVVRDLTEWSQTQPWRIVDTLPSPIKGATGNVEFLSLWLPGPAIISPGAAPAHDS
jgi:23S rRNA (cytidine1920-2'-O)/16S rRNA (cytidine1409-2'-O)-methyltransferase